MVGTIASPHQEPLKSDSKRVSGGVTSSFTGRALSTKEQYSTLGLSATIEASDPIGMVWIPRFGKSWGQWCGDEHDYMRYPAIRGSTPRAIIDRHNVPRAWTSRRNQSTVLRGSYIFYSYQSKFHRGHGDREVSNVERTTSSEWDFRPLTELDNRINRLDRSIAGDRSYG